MAGLRLTDLILAGFGKTPAPEPPRPENPLFDRAFYAEAYPHVVKGGIDLHEHYSYFGCRNGYDPNAYFDSDWYLARNPDVAATGANPLDHYLERGAIEGRDPSPAFGTWLYLMLYPDVRGSGMNALQHYLGPGRAENRIAPPACLVSSLGAMHRAVPADMPRSPDATAAIDLLRQWTDKLAAETRSGDAPSDASSPS